MTEEKKTLTHSSTFFYAGRVATFAHTHSFCYEGNGFEGLSNDAEPLVCTEKILTKDIHIQ